MKSNAWELLFQTAGIGMLLEDGNLTSNDFETNMWFLAPSILHDGVSGVVAWQSEHSLYGNKNSMWTKHNKFLAFSNLCPKNSHACPNPHQTFWMIPMSLVDSRMQHDFESSPRNEENQIHRNLCAHNISKPRQTGNNSAKYRLIYTICWPGFGPNILRVAEIYVMNCRVLCIQPGFQAVYESWQFGMMLWTCLGGTLP